MKTTNYETSLKLQGIGFKVKTNLYFKEYASMVIEYCKEKPDAIWSPLGAYDLETILEALPKSIQYLCGNREYMNQDFKEAQGCLKVTFINGSPFISYICYCHNAPLIETCEENSETLATTAARLLIKLVEEGIINLKE